MRGGFGCSGLGMMEDYRPTGCRGIGDDEAAESPGAAQDAGEEPPILGGWDAADGIVRRHHRLSAGGERGAERRKEILLEPAAVDADRIAVAPAVADVGHEMLWGRHYALPLE